jgi:hypothetical protein
MPTPTKPTTSAQRVNELQQLELSELIKRLSSPQRVLVPVLVRTHPDRA